MAAPQWGSEGMPLRRIWNFRHSEILSRTILQALHQLSTPRRFPSVGINWCIVFSANTAYTIRVIFTKPSKDACLIGIICSHHVHQAQPASLVPRPKEEEGPGFSRLRMRLIISDLTTC